MENFHNNNIREISYKSFDVEVSILSILINEEVDKNSESFFLCEESIEPCYFLNKECRECYETILEIVNIDSTKVSPTLILAKSNLNNGTLNSEIINKIISIPTNNVDINSLIKILSSFYLERKVIEVSNEINSISRSNSYTIQDKIEKIITEVSSFENRKSLIKDKDAILMVNEFLEDLDSNFNRKSNLRGISLGLKELDDKTSGAEGGQLWTIAGRPSMGKTAFALNISNTNLKQGKKGIFYSLEMSSNELTMRMVSNIGRIPIWKIKNPREYYDNEIDWKKTNVAISEISDFNLVCFDEPNLTIEELVIHAKSHKRKNDLDYIIIDYLQLMNFNSKNSSERVQAISNITRKLKILARDLNIPIFILSQLNRSLEQRPNRRPTLSDLRDSGSIEQDSDVVLFLYRDEVYNENSLYKGYGEVIIGKQRNGSIGTIYSNVDLSIMSYKDLDEEDMKYIDSIRNNQQVKKRNAEYDRGF